MKPQHALNVVAGAGAVTSAAIVLATRDRPTPRIVTVIVLASAAVSLTSAVLTAREESRRAARRRRAH